MMTPPTPEPATAAAATAPAMGPGRHRRRRIAIGAALVVAALASLYLYQYATRGAFWRGSFERIASTRAGRAVRVAGDFQLYFAPDLRFRVAGLSIASPAATGLEPLFTARRIAIDMPLWRLLFGPRTISQLVVDGGRLALHNDAAGRNNWRFAGDTPLDLPIIDHARITDTRLRWRDAMRRADVTLLFGDASASKPAASATPARSAPRPAPGAPIAPTTRPVAGTAIAADTPVTAGTRIRGALRFQGGGRLLGKTFTVAGRLTTPDAAMAGGRVGLVLALRAGETRVALSGTLPGATRIDGADLALTVAGRNLQAAGQVFDIALPATRPYQITSRLTRDGGIYRFTRLAGRIGDSDIAGRLTATPAATPAAAPASASASATTAAAAPSTATAGATGRLRLDGVLSSQRLAALDIGPLIGYDPVALDRRGGKAIVRKVAGTARVLPDAPLAVEQLRHFDASIAYRAARIATGTVDLTGLDLKVELDRGLLRLDPLALDIAGGRLSGRIAIDGRGAQVLTDYDLNLAQVPLKRLLTSFDVEDAGATASVRGRLRLRGRGNTVARSLAHADGRIVLVFPKGTIWIRNIQLAKLDVQNFVTAFLGKRLKKPAELRCGVLAFRVSDGRAIADPILFDTTRATYRGRGGFRFDDETLALSIEGKSKEFSLLSGQSPIGINGRFASPGINLVSGELLGRAAAAIGLGLVASPFAAVLAFVDPGGAKDVDCAAMLGRQR